ncbi:hypothetical protein [Tahibacter aquaticus]|nr:hypothetical protein [Tahibacter aquaticus]
MRIDLRTAALTDSEDQRVRIAANLLGAVRIEAKLSPWDGTRCDVVIVNADDAYGRRVMELAQKRGIGLLAYASQAIHFDKASQCHVAEGTAVFLVSALRCVIDAARKHDSAASPGTAAASPAPARHGNFSALMELTHDAWRGRDIDADIAGRRISIRASRGRVMAGTLSDMLAARDALGKCAEPHGFTAVPERRPGIGEISWSLDAFLVDGALRCRQSLPTFAGSAYSLRDWPDLGSAGETLTPLRIASWLQQRSGSVQERAKKAGIGADEVNACLWAFHASNLLVIGEPPAAPAPPAALPARVATPLLSKLAARFGLAW